MTANRLSDTDLAAMKERAGKATEGPWFFTYCAVQSAPKITKDDEFWSEERCNDGHTYDHRVGEICPACGERPAIYSDNAKPELRGQRFGTIWDCALAPLADDIDPTVCTVKPSYGDTATGQRVLDGQFIAHARTDVPALLAEVEALRAELREEQEYNVRLTDEIEECDVLAIRADRDRLRALLDPDNPEAVRAVTDEMSGEPVGSGYYQARLSYDEALDLAVRILTALRAAANGEG